MTVEPIYYVKAFLLKNPGIREHFRELLTASGFTGPGDLRAWRGYFPNGSVKNTTVPPSPSPSISAM